MLSVRSRIGLGLMGAVLIKAILTIIVGFTFDPFLSGIAIVVFLVGLILAISGGPTR